MLAVIVFRIGEMSLNRFWPHRNLFSLLLAQGNHGLLHGSFKAWHSEVSLELSSAAIVQDPRINYLTHPDTLKTPWISAISRAAFLVSSKWSGAG